MSGERDLGRLIINVLFLWGGKWRAAFGPFIIIVLFLWGGKVSSENKGMVITHLNYWQA
jgi:hypothetical protein